MTGRGLFDEGRNVLASVSSLNQALREAERQRRLATRSLEVTTEAKAAIERELRALQVQEKGEREARRSLEGQLQDAQHEIDHLRRLLRNQALAPAVCTSSLGTQEHGPWAATTESWPGWSASSGRGGLLGLQPHQTRVSGFSAVLMAKDLHFSHVRDGREEQAPWSMMVMGEGDGVEGESIATENDVQTIREGVNDLKWENERLDAENTRLHQQLAGMEEKLSLSTTGLAFYRWASGAAQALHRESAHSCSRVMSQMERMLAALSARSEQRLLWRTLGDWRQYASQRKLIRKVLSRLLNGGRLRQLAYRWCIWKKWAVAGRLEEMGSKLRDAASRMRTGLVEKTSGQATPLLLGHAWTAWVAYLQRQRQVKRLLGRRISRKIRAMFFFAWDKWRGTLDHEKLSRRLLGRVLRRLSTALLSKGFRTWRKNLLHTSLSDAKQQRQDKVVEQRFTGLRLVERVLIRIQKKSLSKAMRSWQRALRDQDRATLTKHQDAILRHSVLRLRYKALSQVVAGWKLLVTRRKWLRSVMVRLMGRRSMAVKAAAFMYIRDLCRWETSTRRVLKRVVGTLTHNSLRKGWRTWLLFVVDQRSDMEISKHKSKVAGRFVRHWEERRVVATFRAWQGLVDRRRKLRVIVSRMMRQRRLQDLDQAFNRWKRWLDNAYMEALDGALTGDKARDDDDAVKKPASPWQGFDASKLTPKYRTLTVVTQKSQRLERVERTATKLKARVIKERELRTAQQYLHLWRGFCVRQVRTRAALKRCVTHKILRAHADAFGHWKAVLQRHAAVRSSLLRRLRRFNALLLTKGFHSWRQQVVEIGKKRREQEGRQAACNTIHWVVRRIAIKKLAAAFRTWHHVVQHQYQASLLGALETHREVLARQVMTRLSILSVTKCLNAWKVFVASRGTQRSILARMASSRNLRLMGDAMVRWRQTALLVRAVKAMDKVFLRVFLRHDKKALAKSLGLWYKILMTHRALEAEEKKRLQMVTHFIKLWQGRRATLGVFRAWQDFITRRRKARALLARIDGGRNLVLMGMAFDTWRSGLRSDPLGLLQQGVKPGVRGMEGPHRPGVVHLLACLRWRYQTLRSHRLCKRLAFAIWKASGEGGEDLYARKHYTSSYASSGYPPGRQMFGGPGIGGEAMQESWAEQNQLDDAVAGRVTYYARSLVQSLTICGSVGSILLAVAHQLPPLVSDARCLLLLVDHGQRELWTSTETMGEIRFPLDRCLAGKAVDSGSDVHVRDAQKDPAFNATIDSFTPTTNGHSLSGRGDAPWNSRKDDNVGSVFEVVVVPVMTSHNLRVFGVLHICKERSPLPVDQKGVGRESFAPRHLLVLQLCSALVSMTLHRITRECKPFPHEDVVGDGGFLGQGLKASSGRGLPDDLLQRIQEELKLGDESVGDARHGTDDEAKAVDHLLFSFVRLRTSNASLRRRLRDLTEYTGSLQSRLKQADRKTAKYKARLLTTGDSFAPGIQSKAGRRHLHDRQAGVRDGDLCGSNSTQRRSEDDRELRAEEEHLEYLYGILSSSYDPHVRGAGEGGRGLYEATKA